MQKLGLFFPGSIFNLNLEMKKIKINPLYNKKKPHPTLHNVGLISFNQLLNDNTYL